MIRLTRKLALGSGALTRATALPTLLVPLLGVALAAGCGDDAKPGPGGGSGGVGGKAGSGGKGGSAGKGGGGSAGSSGGKGGGGGTPGDETGGTGSGGKGGKSSGGSAGKGSGGEAGVSDAGDPGTGGTTAGTGGNAGTAGTSNNEGGMGGELDPGPSYAPITKRSDVLLAQVNDLRGLTFASNGKIYASGHVGVNNGDNVTTGTDRQLAILRFNADGTLDDTFGTGGLVTHDIVERVVDSSGVSPVVVNNGNEESYGIRELENGDLIVQVNARDVAGTGQDVLLVKLDSNGARVTAFGTNGVKRIDFGWVDGVGTFPTANQTPSDTSWGIGLDDTTDGDQKIVVFGFGPPRRVTTGTQRVDNDRYIARVHASDGSLDAGFNLGAVFTFNSGGTFGDNGRRGIVSADGSITSAGYTNLGEGLGNHVMVIRLTPAGVLQPGFRFGDGIPGIIGFSTPGVARLNPFLPDGGLAECYSVGRLSTGHFVTTGYGRATAAGVPSSMGYATTDNVDLVSFKLGPDGALDTSYAVNGALAIQSEELWAGLDTEDRGRDVVVLPDDRIVQVGKFGPYPAIYVVKPDGALDENAGLGGRFEYEPLVRAADPNAIPPVTALTTSQFFAAALSPDARTVVAATNNHELGVRVAFLNVASE